jgi:hypothetical protein
MSHKYGCRTVAALDLNSSDRGDSVDGDEVGVVAEGLDNGKTPGVLTIKDREERLIEAAQHVREAQDMQKFAHEKTVQAKADASENRPRSETTKTLFADFS